MPSIESKIYSILSAATVVTSQTTRIYPEHRPAAAALPAVVYSRTAGLRVNHLTGYGNLENANIHFEIFTTSVDTRRSLYDAIVPTMGASNTFSCLLVESPFDDYDEDSGEYMRMFDFSIWNKE